MAAGAGIAVAALQSDLSSAEASERSVRSDLRNLESSSAAYNKAQGELKQKLAALRKEHDALAAQAPVVNELASAKEVIAGLQAGVESDQRIIANLEQQIQVLQQAKAQAQAFEGALDQMIGRLQKDIAGLEVQLKEANRALFGALVNLAIAGFGSTMALRKNGLDLIQRQMLMSVYDLAQGNPLQAVAPLLEKMVTEGLIGAGAGAVLAPIMGALLSPPQTPAGYAAKIKALIDGAASLTAPQRSVLRELERATAFDPEPLALAVIAQPGLTAPQARAIRGLIA
jgi:hypothetical protein